MRVTYECTRQRERERRERERGGGGVHQIWGLPSLRIFGLAGGGVWRGWWCVGQWNRLSSPLLDGIRWVILLIVRVDYIIFTVRGGRVAYVTEGPGAVGGGGGGLREWKERGS